MFRHMVTFLGDDVRITTWHGTDDRPFVTRDVSREVWTEVYAPRMTKLKRATKSCSPLVHVYTEKWS